MRVLEQNLQRDVFGLGVIVLNFGYGDVEFLARLTLGFQHRDHSTVSMCDRALLDQFRKTRPAERNILWHNLRQGFIKTGRRSVRQR